MEKISYLEEKWNQIKLSKGEQNIIVVEKTLSKDDKINERCNLIGKIFTDCHISKQTIRGMMRKIWRISKPTTFIKVGKNMFIVTFTTETDKQKVINGKFWLFDSRLFAIQNMDEACQLAKTMINIEYFWIQIHNLHFRCMNR